MSASRHRTLAGAAVLAVIVALPVLLVLAGVPTPAEVRQTISYHEVSSPLIVGLCAVVGWVAWVWLVATFALEVYEARAHRSLRRKNRPRSLSWAVAPAVVVATSVLRAHGAAASPAPAAVAASAPPSLGASSARMSTSEPSTYAYVVRPGDNLWDLAATFYGDGEAWPVIWHASGGIADPRVLYAGQVLEVPSAGLTPSGQALLAGQSLAGGTTSAQPPEAAAGQTEVVVGPGDTLWSLSPDHDWEAAWELNEGRAEPGGATFNDPNLIDPGWSLEIPAVPGPAPATPSPPPPAASPSPPATSLPSTPSSANAKRTGAPRSAQSGDRSAPAMRHESGRPKPEPLSSSSPSRWAVELLGLGSALGAAGLVAEVRRLRLRQRRARARGAGPSPPIGASSALFARQATRADLDGLSLLDRAVRQLGVELRGAERPDLFGALAEVRLSETELTLLTDEPPVPLASFEVTPEGWRLERVTRQAFPDPDELSPLPGLVSIGGRPEAGELVLCDLEHAGPLAVSGDEAATCSVLRALASEWATAPWADHGQLVAVDVAEELASLDRVSLSDVASAIQVADRARSEATRVLQQTGTDTLAPIRRGELTGLEVGLTLVVVGPGQDAGSVEALVGRAGPGLAVAVAADLDTPLRLDARSGELVRKGREQRLAPAALAEASAAELGELLDPIEQAVPVAGSKRPVDHQAPASPELRLLGLPEVVGGEGKTLTRRAKNLACLLALHPEGVLRSRLEEALSPADSPFRHKSIYNAVTELRRALGSSEEEPKVVMEGERLCLSKDVSCDWWRFLALRQREEPEAWAEALALVRDVPLLGFEDESWVIAGGWAITMSDAVVELALRLGEARLSRGDATGADAAAREGLRSWPGEERLYQLRLRAAHLSGNRRAADQAMAELHEHLHRLSGGEDQPTAETERLYLAVTRGAQGPK